MRSGCHVLLCTCRECQEGEHAYRCYVSPASMSVTIGDVSIGVEGTSPSVSVVSIVSVVSVKSVFQSL